MNYQRIACTKEDPSKHISQFTVFLDLLGRETIQGASVLEVGPGMNLAMAGLFIGAGANRYVAIDRFPGGVFEPESIAYCQSILQAAPENIRQGLADRSLDPSRYPWNDQEKKLISVHHNSLEQASKNFVSSFDVVISHNVVEHLYDIKRAFFAMREVLAPDGVMVHRVDYGPHSIWRQYDNPLMFLTINKRLWRTMGFGRAITNRYRHREILDAMTKAGFSCETRITDRFSVKHVKEIRPRLPMPQKKMSDDDLTVSSAWLVAR